MSSSISLAHLQDPSPGDDSTEDIQVWSIFTLDIMYLALTGYCAFNMYQLGRSKRLQKNKMLMVFYIFAFLTLLCRFGVFTTEICVLKGSDQHSLDGLYDKSDLYSLFSTLPTFLYVILGNIILLFIIELIVHYKKSQLQHQSANASSEKKKRMVLCAKVFVIAEIIVVLAMFTWVMIVKKQNQGAGQEVLRKMRIAFSILVAILYSITFVLLLSTSLFLMSSVFSRFRGSFQKEKKQLLVVLTIFSVSYAYRLCFNFFQIFNFDGIVDLQRYHNLWYSIVIFCLYFIGEVVPLSLILVFQYRNHKLMLQQKKQSVPKKKPMARPPEMTHSYQAVSVTAIPNETQVRRGGDPPGQSQMPQTTTNVQPNRGQVPESQNSSSLNHDKAEDEYINQYRDQVVEVRDGRQNLNDLYEFNQDYDGHVDFLEVDEVCSSEHTLLIPPGMRIKKENQSI